MHKIILGLLLVLTTPTLYAVDTISYVVSVHQAPFPGKTFDPVIHNSLRTNAINKLLTDICNDVQLPYKQDGTIFTNREKLLPIMTEKDYYREYTLITNDTEHEVIIGTTTYAIAPDLGVRGSERVVIGGGINLYYTMDHYKTFVNLLVVY